MNYIIGFGVFRYFLSLLVLFHHLRFWIPLADTADWGLHAVLSFFVLSGYMVAAILDKSYSGTNRIIRFSLNRFLRLMPAHWAVILFMMFTFLVVPEAMFGWGMGKGAANPLDAYSLMQWMGNFFLVGHVKLMNIVTWTLRLEFFLYILALLLFSRQKYVALTGFIIAWVTTLFAPLSEIRSYYPYAMAAVTCMFPFNLGMIIYYWRNKITEKPAIVCLVAVCVSIGFIVGLRLWGIDKEASCQISVILTGVAVLLIQSKRHSTNRSLKKIDEWFGDLSYTIYLTHKPVMIWIGWAAMRHFFKVESIWFVVTMVLFSHLLGLSINRFIEQPIKILRKKIRNRSSFNSTNSG